MPQETPFGDLGKFLHNNESKVVEKIAKTTEDLREGNLDTLPIKMKPTVLDLYGLDIDLLKEGKEKGLLEWVEKETDIPFKFLENKDNKYSIESKKAYEKLNEAYQVAKRFLVTTLKYTESEVYIVPTKLNTKEDLLGLLKNIRVINENTENVDLSKKHCRLVKATIAAYETKKHDADRLASITEYFEDSLLKEENHPFIPVNKYHKEGVEFLAEDENGFMIDGILSSRPKETEGAMLRFINRPETNAETALADGTGARIVVEKEQALKLVPVLCKWLIKDMGVSIPLIENGNYLIQNLEIDEKQELEKKLKAAGIPFDLTDHTPNTNSGDFEVLKIVGSLNFPDDYRSLLFRDRKGKIKPPKEISKHAFQFEIQLVSPDNKNEAGKNDHDVYNVKKYIEARTRLDGWCPKSAFDAFIQGAVKENLDAKTIEGYLLQKQGDADAPVVELGKGNKAVYLSFSVYERWRKLGMITQDRFDKIKNLRNQT